MTSRKTGNIPQGWLPSKLERAVRDEAEAEALPHHHRNVNLPTPVTAASVCLCPCCGEVLFCRYAGKEVTIDFLNH